MTWAMEKSRRNWLLKVQGVAAAIGRPTLEVTANYYSFNQTLQVSVTPWANDFDMELHRVDFRNDDYEQRAKLVIKRLLEIHHYIEKVEQGEPASLPTDEKGEPVLPTGNVPAHWEKALESAERELEAKQFRPDLTIDPMRYVD